MTASAALSARVTYAISADTPTAGGYLDTSFYCYLPDYTTTTASRVACAPLGCLVAVSKNRVSILLQNYRPVRSASLKPQ